MKNSKLNDIAIVKNAALGVSAFATIAFAMVGVTADTASAEECLLDSNGDGFVDPGDTDGGAIGSGANSLACGENAVASGDNATAVGANSTASDRNSTAIGQNSTASHSNSVALGSNTSTIRDNSVSVGNRQITQVADGTAGRDAVNFNQLSAVQTLTVSAQATADANAAAIATNSDLIAANTASISANSQAIAVNASDIAVNANNIAVNSGLIAENAGNIAANSQAIAALQGQSTTLFDLASENASGVREANEGVALALSMESPVLMPTDSFGIAGGLGYYNNRVAGSASFAARIGDGAALTGGVGIGFDEGEVGARAGFQFAW